MDNTKKVKCSTVDCFHCGEPCPSVIETEGKRFCCEGCKQVYLLLNESNLCSYYNLDDKPGIKAKGKFIAGRFAYLDDAATVKKLVQFSSDTQTNVIFKLPQMHCASCIFLLEKLHRIEQGVIRSQVNFQRKEVLIVFDPQKVSLRKVVELLAFIGYEPLISLEETTRKKAAGFNKKQLYKIGIAGFCFANIMMLSFPEYFSSGNIEQPGLKETFTWLNLFLSVPVLFFCASGFFVAAWKGLRVKVLNIDAPIAMAIFVSFARSYFEIISGKGAGWLDSASGIVFFMLVGRWFQDKTYDSLSFDRDYKSYFPLGVNKIINGFEKNVPATQLNKGDRIIVRNGEMVPSDAILISGDASMDYSFVSGETTPVQKKRGELVYAGGKQVAGIIELEVLNDISQSYITQLWNNDIFKHKKNTARSFIHPWSRYFSLAVFSIAALAATFWAIVDVSRLLPAVTAILIVACPCSLLLSATFTYGNMLRIFGKNKYYLKNAAVIESLAKTDTIIFDKTGTITQTDSTAVLYKGTPLTKKELAAVQAVAQQSSHPLSKILSYNLGTSNTDHLLSVHGFKEFPGRGIAAAVNNLPVKIGAVSFVAGNDHRVGDGVGSHIHISLNDVHMGSFIVNHGYRTGIKAALLSLRKKKYELHLLSGDNDSERKSLAKIFGAGSELWFGQSPRDKLEKVKQLQSQHKNVLMLGDGLNDAGALMQSDTGTAVSDSTAQFSPASDAIIDGSKVVMIPQFLAYAKTGKKIVTASFLLSILYNIVGLSFAVQGTMSPIVAAILMPASSISIVLLVTFLSSLSARKFGLDGA